MNAIGVEGADEVAAKRERGVIRGVAADGALRGRSRPLLPPAAALTASFAAARRRNVAVTAP